MIAVNGVDLSTLGVVARRRRLPRLGGEQTAVVPIPGTTGGVRAGALVQPDTLVVDGALRGDGHAELLTNLDALAALLQGEQVLRLADIVDREWHGYLQQGPGSADPYDPQWVARGAALHLEWGLPDPGAIAQAPTGAAGTGAALDVTLDVGTAPSPVCVQVTNAGIAPITRVLITTYRGNTPVDVLQWDGSVSTGKIWTLSDQSWDVTNDGAGALAGLTAASVYPELGPRANRVVVAITGGPANRVEISHYRRWL